MTGIGHYARESPDATALVEGRRRLTYAELDRRQRALIGSLRSEGMKRGHRIAIHGANRMEVLEVSIAALRIGIVPVPIHHLLAPPEIRYLLEDSGARWLFTDRPVDSPPGVERVVTFGDAYERLLHGAPSARIADVALGRPMHYTSGTTGKPKGVLVRPAPEKAARHLSADFQATWELSSDDIHLVCSPLTHSAPHRYALRTLEAGGVVVVQERFDAEETLAAIDLFSITSTFMVPTHLERIFALGDRVLARYDLSTIRLLVHAAAPIREETKRRAIEVFPNGSVWEFYGSTEGQATRISTKDWLRKPGSVGRPREGAEILILGDSAEPLPVGEVGDVWVRDPRAERFQYWRDKKKTRAAWRKGAFTVGDLGSVDEEGYLFLAGRKHDTIISGGVNVYPQEVEAVLHSHPAVTEALVYGAPHEEWGQEVRALVVPAFGQPLDPERLRAWLRERVAGYKCPRLIELVDDLPRTPTGKLSRDISG